MIAWLLSPIGKAVVLAGALLIIIGLIWNAGRGWESDRRDVKDAASKIEAYEDRKQIDEEIKSYDRADLCRALDGTWENDRCQ